MARTQRLLVCGAVALIVELSAATSGVPAAAAEDEPQAAQTQVLIGMLTGPVDQVRAAARAATTVEELLAVEGVRFGPGPDWDDYTVQTELDIAARTADVGPVYVVDSSQLAEPAR